MANVIQSGKKGTLMKGGVEVGNVAMWSLSSKPKINTHGSNSTGCFKGRSSGTYDVTGKMKVYFTDDVPPELIPGVSYAFEFHVDDTTNNYYSGNCMVETNGELTVDMDEGAEISNEYTWGCNGAITANGNVPKIASV